MPAVDRQLLQESRRTRSSSRRNARLQTATKFPSRMRHTPPIRATLGCIPCPRSRRCRSRASPSRPSDADCTSGRRQRPHKPHPIPSLGQGSVCRLAIGLLDVEPCDDLSRHTVLIAVRSVCINDELGSTPAAFAKARPAITVRDEEVDLLADARRPYESKCSCWMAQAAGDERGRGSARRREHLQTVSAILPNSFAWNALPADAGTLGNGRHTVEVFTARRPSADLPAVRSTPPTRSQRLVELFAPARDLVASRHEAWSAAATRPGQRRSVRESQSRSPCYRPPSTAPASERSLQRHDATSCSLKSIRSLGLAARISARRPRGIIAHAPSSPVVVNPLDLADREGHLVLARTRCRSS